MDKPNIEDRVHFLVRLRDARITRSYFADRAADRKAKIFGHILE